MKKLLAILLAAVMMLSFVACGQKSTGEETSSDLDEEVSVTQQEVISAEDLENYNKIFDSFKSTIVTDSESSTVSTAPSGTKPAPTSTSAPAYTPSEVPTTDRNDSKAMQDLIKEKADVYRSKHDSTSFVQDCSVDYEPDSKYFYLTCYNDLVMNQGGGLHEAHYYKCIIDFVFTAEEGVSHMLQTMYNAVSQLYGGDISVYTELLDSKYMVKYVIDGNMYGCVTIEDAESVNTPGTFFMMATIYSDATNYYTGITVEEYGQQVMDIMAYCITSGCKINPQTAQPTLKEYEKKAYIFSEKYSTPLSAQKISYQETNTNDIYITCYNKESYDNNYFYDYDKCYIAAYYKYDSNVASSISKIKETINNSNNIEVDMSTEKIGNLDTTVFSKDGKEYGFIVDTIASPEENLHLLVDVIYDDDSIYENVTVEEFAEFAREVLTYCVTVEPK